MSHGIITLHDGCLELLHGRIPQSIFVETLGCHYEAQVEEAQNESIINYYPESSGIVYYNSFLPEIRVEIMKDLSEEKLHINSRLRKSVRIGLYCFYTLLLLFQVRFLFFYFSEAFDVVFPLFIPTIIAVFLFTLSAFGVKINTIIFMKEYQVQVERMLATLQGHGA